MRMLDWAEQECRIACKRENPKFDFDNEKDWDYGCSCYKSALKAYQSLCNDNHSGSSFSFTRNILIRLIEWLIEHINDYLTHGRDIDLMFDDIRNAIKLK